MVILVALWTIAFEIVAGVQCGDKPWAAWTGSKNYFKYCTRAFPYLLGFAISDFLTDLIIVLLPLPKVRMDSGVENRSPLKFALDLVAEDVYRTQSGHILRILIGFGVSAINMFVVSSDTELNRGFAASIARMVNVIYTITSTRLYRVPIS